MVQKMYKIYELPSITPLPFLRKIIYNKDYYFDFFVKGKIRRLFIAKDFQSDGGSIPRIAWSTTMTPFAPEGIIPFSFHDQIYGCGGTWEVKIINKQEVTIYLKLTRNESDKLLREMLKYFGVNMYIRNKIYYVLKNFGWYKWNKCRKADKKL